MGWRNVSLTTNPFNRGIARLLPQNRPTIPARRWNVSRFTRYCASMTVSLTFQDASARDTVVSVAARDGYDLLDALAAGSVAATFLAVLLLILYGLVQTRRMVRSLKRARREIASDPTVESIRRTANNVESISRALNQEVAKLSESVSSLSDRLSQASDRMEERIEEFNAFMEVVQGEAEGAFVEGAATARGVRAGLGNLGRKAGGHVEKTEPVSEAASEEGSDQHVTRGKEDTDGLAAGGHGSSTK